jgi:hypothetical protein
MATTPIRPGQHQARLDRGRPHQRHQQPAHLRHSQRQQAERAAQAAAPPFAGSEPLAWARVTTRNACASRVSVTWRYQPGHLRTCSGPGRPPPWPARRPPQSAKQNAPMNDDQVGQTPILGREGLLRLGEVVDRLRGRARGEEGGSWTTGEDPGWTSPREDSAGEFTQVTALLGAESGGSPGAARWDVAEPGVDPDQVERQRGQHVLQVGLGQPAVAGLVKIGAAGALGDGALDSGAVGVALPPGWGGLLGA